MSELCSALAKLKDNLFGGQACKQPLIYYLTQRHGSQQIEKLGG